MTPDQMAEQYMNETGVSRYGGYITSAFLAGYRAALSAAPIERDAVIEEIADKLELAFFGWDIETWRTNTKREMARMACQEMVKIVRALKTTPSEAPQESTNGLAIRFDREPREPL